MRIRTDFDPKPIPDRNHDWSAWDDDTYDGSPGQPLGWGKTERDAIDDLLEQIEERGCETCLGAGETVHRGYGGDPINDYAKPCTACKGTGRPTALNCDKCGGAGKTHHPRNRFDDIEQPCKSCFGTGRMTW